MISKILFTTEYSNHATEVFKYALEMAYRFDADLIALNVFGVSEVRMNTTSYNEQASKLTETLRTFVDENMPNYYEKKIEVTCMVEIGFAADSILRVAEEEEVDLIVMGMSGKTNALEKIFGTVSTEVVQRAHCPVLVIPATAKFSKIRRLTYANDFEFRDISAIFQLTDWGEKLKAQIHCLHVWEDGEKEKTLQRNIEVLYQIFGRKRDPKLTFEIQKGELSETLYEYCKTEEVDILVMASHKRNYINRMIQSNTSLQIAQKVKVPILILKEDE